jgi:hypothetical protein
MFHRNALLLFAGAAIFALDASASSAQDTTRTKRARSSRHIPISKESPGEVVPPRVDTVTVYRTDTVRLRPRVDTVTRTNTVTRIDTVVQTVNIMPRMVGGFYAGLAAGAAVPAGSLREGTNTGGLGQLQIGWQGLKNLLGGRIDASYSKYGEDRRFTALEEQLNLSNPKAELWNINFDAKLNIPGATHWFGLGTRFTPYVLGGGTWVDARNLRLQLQDAPVVVVNPLNVVVGPGNVVLVGNADQWHSEWGWNAGGGLGWHMGSKEVFVESRAIWFNDNRKVVIDGTEFKTGHAWQVPVIFGVNFF